MTLSLKSAPAPLINDEGRGMREEVRPHLSALISRPSSLAVGIDGIGAYVPEDVLTNADLERLVETSDEWIVSRTGISERRIVAEGESTSDLAVEAGRRALDHA